MIIRALEAIPVRVPRRADILLHTAHGRSPTTEAVVLRLHTDEGIEGLGEATVSPLWNGEDAATAAHCLTTHLGEAAVGRDPFDVEGLLLAMDRQVKGHPFAKAAVEMACWDVIGKGLGQPLYRVLGGAVRCRIPTKFVVSAAPPAEAARIAAAGLALGFTTLKVKVGIAPDEDVARVRAVREVAGISVRLTVDANTGWTVPDARRVIPRLAGLGVELVEQPIPADDVRALAEVRGASPVPIMADESVFTPAQAFAVLAARAADVLSVYPGKNGGLVRARGIAHMAAAAGAAAHLGSNLELGIASAAMVHLGVAVAAIECERYPGDLIGPLYHEGDVVTPPAAGSFVHPGYAEAPAGPGLGVRLEEEALARFRMEV